MKLFLSAADKGHPYAQFIMYLKLNRGTAENAEKAKKRLYELAETGNGRDMWRLARLFYKNKIESNPRDAYDYFLKGAKLGYARKLDFYKILIS